MAKKKLNPLRWIIELFRALWRITFLFYAALLVIGMFGIIVVVLSSFSSDKAQRVQTDSVLVWAPAGELVSQDKPEASFLHLLTQPSEPVAVVRDYAVMLDRARKDSRISGVYLKLNKLTGAQPGQLEELGAAIEKFKTSGKKVIAWSDTYNQAQYYLASRADTVLMDPMGQVFLRGFGVYRNYYAAALDKLGVEVNVFRVGKYKSFVEPYIRNDMSEDAKRANKRWLNALWGQFSHDIVDARSIDADTLADYANHFGHKLAAAQGNGAALASKAGLIDGIYTQTSAHDKVSKLAQHSINGQAYLAQTQPPAQSDVLALIVLDGAIVDGPSVAGAAGGQTIAKLISQARQDSHIKGVLLRVNSPGGSVTAAEKIRREVVKTRQAGKPVVVSMSGMAASGGYWVSMDANEIWALPTTLTGSIGVFGVIPTFNKSLHKLGINNDGLGTTDFAGAMRLDRPMSQGAKAMVQADVEHIYQRFIGQVGQARDMSLQQVDKLAQGRVWSGLQAKKNGLVDHLGGLRDAAQSLAKQAGVKKAYLKLQQPPQSWRQALKQLLVARVDMPEFTQLLGQTQLDDLAQILAPITSDPRGLYSRCGCQLQVGTPE